MKIPVFALYKWCETMLQDKWGYIYGTSGVLCTQSTINNSCDRFPENADTTAKYGPKWIGHVVTDCSGVMVYIWSKFGLSIPHGSNSMINQKYVVELSPTPKPGYAAFTFDGVKYNHVGIVNADATLVYEASGTKDGFITSKVTNRKWKYFGRFKDVDYTAERSVNTVQGTIVTKSSQTVNVRSGPSTDDPIIGKVVRGSTVAIIAEAAGWSFIEAAGIQGYVRNDFIQRIEDTQKNEQPVQEAPVMSEQVITSLVSKDGTQHVDLLGEWAITNGVD